jgi:hypothetical protein
VEIGEGKQKSEGELASTKDTIAQIVNLQSRLLSDANVTTWKKIVANPESSQLARANLFQ